MKSMFTEFQLQNYTLIVILSLQNLTNASATMLTNASVTRSTYANVSDLTHGNLPNMIDANLPGLSVLGTRIIFEKCLRWCIGPILRANILTWLTGEGKIVVDLQTGIQPEPFVMSVYSEKTMMVFCLLCEFRDKYLVHQTIDFIQSSFHFTFIQLRYNINKTICGGGGRVLVLRGAVV